MIGDVFDFHATPLCWPERTRQSGIGVKQRPSVSLVRATRVTGGAPEELGRCGPAVVGHTTESQFRRGSKSPPFPYHADKCRLGYRLAS